MFQGQENIQIVTQSHQLRTARSLVARSKRDVITRTAVILRREVT